MSSFLEPIDAVGVGDATIVPDATRPVAAVVTGDDVRWVTTRTVTGRAGADPETVAALARRLEGARKPVMVAGPDVDASGGWDLAIALAEKQRLGVWASPAPGGGRYVRSSGRKYPLSGNSGAERDLRAPTSRWSQSASYQARGVPAGGSRTKVPLS